MSEHQAKEKLAEQDPGIKQALQILDDLRQKVALGQYGFVLVALNLQDPNGGIDVRLHRPGDPHRLYSMLHDVAAFYKTMVQHQEMQKAEADRRRLWTPDGNVITTTKH